MSNEGGGGGRRDLHFKSEDEVIAELGWLRRGYRQLGQWTLPQIAWHLSKPIELYLVAPEDFSAKPTPEQAQRQATFFERCHRPRGFDGMTAPGPMTPPAECGEEDIDRYIAQLRRLKAYPHEVVEMGPVGPAPFAECRNAHLAHAAHHLSFLVPLAPSRRSWLKFQTVDDAIADVQNLRKGWVQTSGQWTLPQICWHLNMATQTVMAPGPQAPDTPEQVAARPRLKTILEEGRITAVPPAPQRAIPPADAGDEAIDAFLATLEKLKNFPGPFGPHRIFGTIPDDDMRRLALIHCAHHLGYLAPKEPAV
jgi:hypothetical protein